MTTVLTNRARTLTSHRGARVALDELGVAHATADLRDGRRRPVAPAAPPEAVTLAGLPLALLTHDCSHLCAHGNHVVPVVVERHRSGVDVDNAATLGGVRAALIRLARPAERRRVPAAGLEVRVVVWSDR